MNTYKKIKNKYLVEIKTKSTYGTFWIDEEDYDKIKNYTWSFGKSRNYTCVRGFVNGKLIKLHRFLLDVTDTDLVVDHIDRNPLNNCRSNIRIATPTINAMNKDIKSNSLSGVRGVYWDKVKCKWEVIMFVYGKSKTIGHYDSFEEACNVRRMAEKDFWEEQEEIILKLNS